jgi:uncharacterized protein (DUF433 family)
MGEGGWGMRVMEISLHSSARGFILEFEREPLMTFDRITFDPGILGGRACIRGMRIPVSVVVSQLAHGAPVEEILENYPDLEPEDVTQALEYVSWLAEEQVHSA